MSAHPIPDSYWADVRLLAGPHPGDRASVRALLDAGVQTVIDLRTPVEPPSIRVLLEKFSDDAVWMGIPILDGAAPSIAGMKTILDAIDASIARERAVYVHCQGGRGRTGTVVACWWIRHGRFEVDSALEELSRCRLGQPNGALPSPETGAQLRLVKQWARGQ